MRVFKRESIGFREAENCCRIIAIARSPRKRDFLKVLFGNYEPTLTVYADEAPEGGIRVVARRFTEPLTDAELDFAAFAVPSDFEGRAGGLVGGEGEVARLRKQLVISDTERGGEVVAKRSALSPYTPGTRTSEQEMAYVRELADMPSPVPA